MTNGWTITVTGFVPDATASVLAANRFNSPPAAGKQFAMISVRAVYNGAGSSRLYLNFRFRAVGASNVSYGSDIDDDCGVLPDPSIKNNSNDVFTGGSIEGNVACWSVKTSDVPSLEMYLSPTLFFALH
jgi:hypothetical protein